MGITVAHPLLPDSRLIIDNYCWVSPGFTNSDTLRHYSTVKAAIDYVTVQVPTVTSPWVIYIYPGVYEEVRGIWIDEITESSMIVPDYCFLHGADRDTVIIKPDGNISGEGMNLFGAIQEKDKDPGSSSHIGFSNLTLTDCLYGCAVQSDSFIKKPDYPEFRVYVDNVKIMNCETGLKMEERNSWCYVNQIFLENCEIGLHVDDAKMFCSGVMIRQRGATNPQLLKGLYAQDKKGKIQVVDLDIGIDWDGRDIAFAHGMEVVDKAEIHVYDGRVDNANIALVTDDTGEFKGWNVKFHDSAEYDIFMSGVNDDVELYNAEMKSPIKVQYGRLSLYNVVMNTKDFTEHAIQWNAVNGARLRVIGGRIKVLGKDSGTGIDYHAIHFTQSPDDGIHLTNVMFEYDDGEPDYLVYAASTVNANVNGCDMDSGMNGNIITSITLKHVGGRMDRYSTIQDAIDASTAGDTVLVEPGTYEEQITLKTRVTIQGRNRDVCILQYSDQPIQPVTVAAKVENMSIKTTVQGNTIMEMRSGDTLKFDNCVFDNGTVRVASTFLVATMSNCLFSTGDPSVYCIESSGTIGYTRLWLNDCTIWEPAGGINWTANGTSGWRCLYINRLTGNWGRMNLSGNFNLEASKNVYFGEETALLNLSTSGNVSISGCTFDNGVGNAIRLTGVPSTFEMVGCIVKYSIDYDVFSTVTISGATVISNVMMNGMNGNIQTISPTKYVQGGIDFYKTVQDAVDGASSGNLVSIAPGTYTEQVVLKSGITVQGIDKDTTTIQYSSEPISLDAGYTESLTRDLTIQVTSSGNKILEISSKYPEFHNCIFKDGYITTGVITGNMHTKFEGCELRPPWGTPAIDVTTTDSSKFCNYTFSDTFLTGNVEFSVAMGKLSFADCEVWAAVIFEASGTSSLRDLEIKDSKITAMMGDTLTIQQTGVGTVRGMTLLRNDFGVEWLGSNILFKTNPSIVIMSGNQMKGAVVGKFDIEVASGVTITGAALLANTMTTGIGGDGVFQYISPIKFVGGDIDYYTTIQHALNGVTTNNQKIVLKADQTITVPLLPPSYQIMISGLHQFAIIRSAGNPIMTLDTNDSVKFEQIDLLGSIDVAGNNVTLELADHVYLAGHVDIQSGNAGSNIRFDQCKIIADSSDHYAIRINNADPTVVIKRAYLKGNGTNPAIYWNVSNNHVKIANSSIMSGDLIVAPFNRNGAININYYSHHDAYNLNPETDVNFVNQITGHNDTFDSDADY